MNVSLPKHYGKFIILKDNILYKKPVVMLIVNNELKYMELLCDAMYHFIASSIGKFNHDEEVSFFRVSIVNEQMKVEKLEELYQDNFDKMKEDLLNGRYDGYILRTAEEIVEEYALVREIKPLLDLR